jgi:Kyakuja-Dileera-Zisupton transposase
MQSDSLSIPLDLNILPAVVKFHLSAHKLECFPRFSLMFIKGTGHIDGEILETLWASFNKISPSARSMSAVHHQELYDDHVRDSNWKKLVGIGIDDYFL